MATTALGGKRRQILEFIATQVRERGYPPTVREIGTAVGLTSSSTVHTHLQVLQREGYLQQDPTKPRAIVVKFEPESGAAVGPGPVVHVPLVGDVAAGTGVLAEENVEEVLALPEQLTGRGRLFVLRVRGDSMTGDGILPDDLVVVRQQSDHEPGDILAVGIPGGEATIKRLKRRRGRVVLVASNPVYDEMELAAEDVTVYGKVVSVLRKL